MNRQRSGEQAGRPATARLARAGRSAIEALEGRRLLAAQIVGSPTIYPTIQAAVDAATPGATVTVDAGTYPEQVVISQPITIQGAQAGVDARIGSRANGSGASESVITGATLSTGQSSAFYINANDVTIDGFTVQGETNQNIAFGAGIVIAAGQHGTHILDNIVQNNVSGLFLANNGATDAALIQHNLFRNNNNDGLNGGRGIYSNEDLSGGNLTNVSIDSNTFTNNYGGQFSTGLEAACALEASVAGEQSHISLTNNQMTGNGKAALFFNATNIAISGNTITGCQDQYSGSIRFEGNVQNVTISGNRVYNNTGPAVAVDSKGYPGSNSGFVLSQNDFSNNNAAYGTHISVVYNTGDYDGVFNAQNNWWGSASGPSGDGPGAGDAVSAGVFQAGTGKGWALLAGGNTLYSPWSVSPNTTSGIPPAAPTGLSAVATSATHTTLKWTDTAAGIENGFVVQRSIDGITFAQVGTTNTGVTTFADTTAPASTLCTYRVYANSNIGSSAYSTVATVTTPAVAVVPSAPTNLAVAAHSSTQASLSWKDSAAGIETGFIVQRSSDGKTFTEVGTAATGVTAFVDSMLLPGTTYTWRVVATSAAGPSPVSNTAALTTPTSAAVAAAPTALKATAVLQTRVNLSWTDAASGIETGFVIQRAIGSSTTYTQIGTALAGVTTYADTTAVAKTPYAYRIYATSTGGNSPYSPVAKATTPALPTAPASLHAVVASATKINLSWTHTAVGVETGFLIQRATGSSTIFAQIATTPAGVLTYSDPSVSAGTTYTYRVQATSAGGNSAWSTVASTKTPAVAHPVAATAPTSLKAIAASSTLVNLSWVHVIGSSATGFVIQRSPDGVHFTAIGTTAGGVLTFKDQTVSAGVVYTYRVQATSAAGGSAFSNLASVKTPALAAIPIATAPTNLKAAVISATQINLAWTDASAKIETGFILQRSTDGVHFVQIGETAVGVVVYSDKSAAAGVSYTYRVQAMSAGGTSPISNSASAKTPALPTPATATAPTALKATVASSTQVNLSWTDTASGVETGFVVERSVDGVHFSDIATTAIGVKSYNDPGVSTGVVYSYRVRAVSAGGSSPESTVATAHP